MLRRRPRTARPAVSRPARHPRSSGAGIGPGPPARETAARAAHCRARNMAGTGGGACRPGGGASLGGGCGADRRPHNRTCCCHPWRGFAGSGEPCPGFLPGRSAGRSGASALSASPCPGASQGQRGSAAKSVPMFVAAIHGGTARAPGSPARASCPGARRHSAAMPR